jgi:hypothetical protein
MYYCRRSKAISDVKYLTAWVDCDCVCVCGDVRRVYGVLRERERVLNISVRFSVYKELRHVYISPQTLFPVYLTY